MKLEEIFERPETSGGDPLCHLRYAFDWGGDPLIPHCCRGRRQKFFTYSIILVGAADRLVAALSIFSSFLFTMVYTQKRFRDDRLFVLISSWRF